MRMRDAIKVKSVVVVQVVLDTAGTLCLPVGTLGRVTGQETRRGKRFWVVSFPLPQIDATSIMFHSAEHPQIQVLYQTQELRRVHWRKPRPATLVVARYSGEGEYVLYEVTRDERLSSLTSLVELGAMSFPDPPIGVASVQQVRQFCARQGWHLLYKEGDQPYRYSVELGSPYDGDKDIQAGTLLAATQEEAYQRALHILLRDYPREEGFSSHERVRVSSRGENDE